MEGPDDLSDDDRTYIEQHRRAFERQAAVRKTAAFAQRPAQPLTDEDRKRAAQEHMRAVQSSSGKSGHPMESAAVQPAPVSQAVSGTAIQHGSISIMIAVQEDSAKQISPSFSSQKFAPDWPSMRDIISKHDGTWTVSRFEFSPSVVNILGFFKKEGWRFPEQSEREVFDVIVRNGRVFRTDPE